jgi:thioredoxin
MKEITPQELENKINSGEKFVVDFFATWCGPCKMLSKILEEHHTKFGVPVYKFDIDQDHQICIDNGIRSVPTILLFSDSSVKNRHVGILQDNQFSSFVNQ